MRVKNCFWQLPTASKLQPQHQKKIEKKAKKHVIQRKVVSLYL